MSGDPGNAGILILLLNLARRFNANGVRFRNKAFPIFDSQLSILLQEN
jgi:hypothetical protein